MLALSPAVALLLTTAGVALALLAQLVLAYRPYALVAWLLYAVAALIVVASTWKRLASAAAPPRHGPAPQHRRRLWHAACGAAALGAVLATTWLSAADRRPVLALGLWLAGMLLGPLAVRRWIVTPPVRAAVRWTWWEVAAVTGIVGLGAVARYAWIGSLPPYIFHDEPLVGIALKVHFKPGMVPNFFTMGWNTWSYIGLGVQGILAPFFGLHTTTLRMSSALMGTLAVLTTYLLARELFSRRVALLAAFLLAICRTAIDFSRLGVCHAQVMLLATFAFFWWWRAINTGTAASYVWAGIGLGLCFYTYNAGHALPVLWGGWVVVCALWAPRSIATHWRGVLFALFGFWLAAFPWVYYATDHFTFQRTWFEWTWMAHNRQVLDHIIDLWRSQGADPAVRLLGDQAARTWLGFTAIPAGAYGVGYRGGGMLDHVTAALFILGLALALAHLGRRDTFVPYWLVLTAIAGSVLTLDPPATVRIVGIVPALALLAALPLDALLRTVDTSKPARVVALSLTGILLVGASWNNWRTYFVTFAASEVDDTSDLARRLERLPRETTILLLGPEHWLTFHRELFALNFAGQRVENSMETTAMLPIHEPIESPLALVLGPSQVTLARYIQSLYPHADSTDSVRKADQRLLYRLIRIGPEEIRARAGLGLTDPDAAAAAIVADPFSAEPLPVTPAQRVRWSGSIYWPTDRAVTVRLRSTAPAAVHIADAPAVQVQGAHPAEIAVQLPRGWRPLTIDESEVRHGRGLVLSIADAGGERTVTRWDLRPDTAPEGVLAEYQRDGSPILRAIEPQLNSLLTEALWNDVATLPVHMPFTVSWRSSVRIADPGAYQFEAIGSGPYSIHIDGTPLCEVLAVVPEEPYTCRGTRTLTSGLHPLTAQFDSTNSAHTTRRIFQLFWTPPGGERELVPPTNFVPPPSAR